MTLLPFREDGPCPKCGLTSKYIKVQYIRAARASVKTTYGIRAEHLHKSCPCGYWWKEMTADGSPNKGE